jgi:hypothetical protein
LAAANEENSPLDWDRCRIGALESGHFSLRFAGGADKTIQLEIAKCDFKLEVG